ncbi:hypothetical protein QCE47_05835 [Caballeronia sp. LZ025]|jgi:hypothetical protein|uniref:hypothetical protein n=1 Tax=Caballeronia TaxID=1827195 RepID=UPI001FD29520|nr:MULTISPECIES: hypothetical protein [Caballeronia]MDR5731867.1 hypothetical protein [Caballeronia sp. LZ025]
MFTDDIERTYELTDMERVMVSRFANRFCSNREVDFAVVKGIVSSVRYSKTGQMGNRRAPKLLQAMLRIV